MMSRTYGKGRGWPNPWSGDKRGRVRGLRFEKRRCRVVARRLAKRALACGVEPEPVYPVGRWYLD